LTVSGSIGRVYGHHSTGWFWAMNAFGPGILQRNYELSGNVDTEDEAAAVVERCYDACLFK